MTVASAVRAVGERWLLLVAGVLVGLAVAAAASAMSPTSYQATSGVYLTDLRDPPGEGAGSAPGSTYAERFRPYPRLMTSDRVLGPAAARLGIQGGADALAGAVTVSPADGPTVLTVTATWSGPEPAAAIANAVADSFVETVVATERPPGSTAPPLVAASVVDKASPPTEPIGPTTRANLVLGAVVGLFLVAGYILLRAALDTSVWSAAALRALTGGVVLGALPRMRGRRRDDAPETEVEQAARRICTHMFLTLPAGRPRTLVFTSPERGDGTTTAVRVLARTLARTSSVLLIDADLRRPASANHVGLPGAPGLGELVTRRASPAEVIEHCDGLDVLVAGTTDADPAELLADARLGDVLLEMRSAYEWILVDTPALQPALDAALVARHADGVVLLCRERVTTTAQVTSALEALRSTDTPVLGSILTAATTRRSGSSDDTRVPGEDAREAPVGGVSARTRQAVDGPSAAQEPSARAQHSGRP